MEYGPNGEDPAIKVHAGATFGFAQIVTTKLGSQAAESCTFEPPWLA